MIQRHAREEGYLLGSGFADGMLAIGFGLLPGCFFWLAWYLPYVRVSPQLGWLAAGVLWGGFVAFFTALRPYPTLRQATAVILSVYLLSAAAILALYAGTSWNPGEGFDLPRVVVLVLAGVAVGLVGVSATMLFLAFRRRF